MIEISVVLPTFNPNIDRLQRTLEGLAKQTFLNQSWELLIIDNNSTVRFVSEIDKTLLPDTRIIPEPKQGLTFARLKGFTEAKGALIVLVDDDNILAADYLQNVSDIFRNDARLGAIGGKSSPLFEQPAPQWLAEFYGNLALRDLGDKVIINSWEQRYPPSAPLGAGMAIRKVALQSYITKIHSQKNVITDRTGNNLSSGGDNDIVLNVLKAGWQAGYFPSLSLVHIIPNQRLHVKYLARLVNNTNKSWIILLREHKISPWQKIAAWSVMPRKIKAWFTYKPWRSDANYIRWRGACGTFDGLAQND